MNSKYDVYKCNVEILRCLSSNYNIVMFGPEYGMLSVKILFEPGKNNVSIEVRDTIKKIDTNNLKAKSGRFVDISTSDLLLLCNYKNINFVNILINDIDKFNHDVKNGILYKLRRDLISTEVILDIIGSKDMFAVNKYFEGKLFSEETKSELMLLYYFANTDQVNKNLIKQKPHF